MASIGKKEFAKKDMNFFSEFAASSQAVARIMGYMIIGGIVVAALLVTLAIVQFIRWGVIKTEVKYYDQLFQSADYANLQVEAEELAKKAETNNRYAYIISAIRAEADKETGVKFQIIDEINNHIPSSTVLTGYSIDKGTLKITGEAHTYYAMTQVAHMLNGYNFFTNVNVAEKRWDPSEDMDENDMALNFINAKYEFEITANLDAQYCVSIMSVAADGSILSLDDSQMYDSGAPYEKENVAQIEISGQKYDLTSISINGIAISDEDLQSVISADKFAMHVTADAEIILQYTPQATTTEEEA